MLFARVSVVSIAVAPHRRGPSLPAQHPHVFGRMNSSRSLSRSAYFYLAGSGWSLAHMVPVALTGHSSRAVIRCWWWVLKARRWYRERFGFDALYIHINWPITLGRLSNDYDDATSRNSPSEWSIPIGSALSKPNLNFVNFT